jgi:hypothetical protein
VVADEVLAKVGGEALAVYVVWMPVLGGDGRRAVPDAQGLITDARARHFWNGDQSLGIAYARTMALPMGKEPAWDIYLAYGPGVEWTDEVPPPTDWSHQLGIDERHLADGTRLRTVVEGLLKAAEGARDDPRRSAP